MTALLVRLNYGLRDLRFIELEKSGFTHAEGSENNKTLIRRKAVFYAESYHDADENISGGASQLKFFNFSMHAHKLVNGLKSGSPCPKKDNMHEIFSIGAVPCGGFLLKVNKILLEESRKKLRVNDKKLCLQCDRRNIFPLSHGDIIECFNDRNPYFRVMFLLPSAGADGRRWKEQQSSPLLTACPLDIQKRILQYLTPAEALKNAVADSHPFHMGTKMTSVTHARRLAIDISSNGALQQLYTPPDATIPLFRASDWRNLKALELHTWDYDHCLVEFLKSEALAGLELKRLLLKNVDTENPAWGRCLSSKEPYPVVEQDIPQLLHFLGSGVLRSLYVLRLPMKMDEEAWILAQKLGTFAVLESLSFYGDLKSLWVQNSTPERVVLHLSQMPSLEKLWIFRDATTSMNDDQMPLDAFAECPEEWLTNLKFISADLWETYIPYSKMTNLECVGFSFQNRKALGRSLESVFEELRGCPKLRGLLLHVPRGFQFQVLSQMPQKLEFAALSGANRRCLVSALNFLAQSQSSLDDLWVEMEKPREFEEVLQALRNFKCLKNVVLVVTENTPTRSIHSFERAMQVYLGSPDKGASAKEIQGGVSVQQATLLVSEYYGYKAVVYSFELEKKIPFSFSAITNFFFDWLKDVPTSWESLESPQYAIVSSIFRYGRSVLDMDEFFESLKNNPD
ncbi:unnamed protein product [Notodromas monacha]|uniref:Uncharacterized protein n=1 Tax=Notodromas monacha TaxID=399045 RepID=A0A7R9BDX5_9CRUS|nr:unnamed protein product [Notodromas monacha]CAG0913569.1 unnamed protein product [Notodromas monacha]